MDIVIEADAQRRRALGWDPARYRPFQRVWIEPWFNALGGLLGCAVRGLPNALRQRCFFYLNQTMAGHAPENNPDLPHITNTCTTLARDLQMATGQWPAFFVLTSHPETVGPLAWLRFELLRQALVVAEAVAQEGRQSFPQCFLAIDPYALDTVSPAVGGFYSGFMKQVYLVWDRQPSTQSWIQRHGLLRGTGTDQIAWRLLERLKGNPVLMVLSGGLPYNARLLYAAREFVQRLKSPRWPFPKRVAEKQFLEILMKPVNQVRPAENGDLPPVTAHAVEVFLSELGFSPEHVQGLLKEWAAEWRQKVPYRQRLFQMLIRRLVMRGKPLLILTVSHGSQAPYVQVHAPCALFQDAQGRLRWTDNRLEKADLLDLPIFLSFLSHRLNAL